jgi:hypothetical protein
MKDSDTTIRLFHQACWRAKDRTYLVVEDTNVNLTFDAGGFLLRKT